MIAVLGGIAEKQKPSVSAGLIMYLNQAKYCKSEILNQTLSIFSHLNWTE